MELKPIPSDEYASYTGQKLVPQKSGYMLASTAALRLVPGAKPQPLHRVSLSFDRFATCILVNHPLAGPDCLPDSP